MADIDAHARVGTRHAQQSGRSWWSVRFTDGRIINEWDADPGSPNGHEDWVRLATMGKLRGIQAIRLYCPNGRLAELGEEGDATGKIWQFKVAARYVGGGGSGRDVLAHVIGIVTGYDGQCTMYAWELLPEPEPPPGCPRVPAKPDYMNREQPLWALKEQHNAWLEAHGAYEAYMTSPAYVDWQRQRQAWLASGGGQLSGPIHDNVYNLAYHKLGQVHALPLGLDDGYK